MGAGFHFSQTQKQTPRNSIDNTCAILIGSSWVRGEGLASSATTCGSKPSFLRTDCFLPPASQVPEEQTAPQQVHGLLYGSLSSWTRAPATGSGHALSGPGRCLSAEERDWDGEAAAGGGQLQL